MRVLDTLRQAQGGQAIVNLARAYNITPAEAETVLAAVIPELSQKLERNTLSRGGLANLVNAIGQGHHEAYVDNPAMFGHPAARADGDAILGHIVGTKDGSRAIASHAAASTGLSSGIIKMMLPVIAGMLMGGLSKQMKGGLGDILGRMGGAAPQPSGQQGSGFPEMPRMPQFPSGQGQNGQGQSGGWGAPQPQGRVGTNAGGGLEMPRMPDNGGGGWGQTGNQTGGMPSGGGNMSGSPLPMPGDRVPGIPGNADNPLGDLADILRRGMGLPGGGGGGQMPFPQGGGQGGGLPFPMPQGGGQGGGLPLPVPGGGGVNLPNGPIGGGMLWNIVRSILGSALGFQSKGIMSWLIRMVVMKYGWSILRTILGRGLLGR